MHDSLTGQLLLILLVKRPIKVITYIRTTSGASCPVGSQVLVVETGGHVLKAEETNFLSFVLSNSFF